MRKRCEMQIFNYDRQLILELHDDIKSGIEQLCGPMSSIITAGRTSPTDSVGSSDDLFIWIKFFREVGKFPVPSSKCRSNLAVRFFVGNFNSENAQFSEPHTYG